MAFDYLQIHSYLWSLVIVFSVSSPQINAQQYPKNSQTKADVERHGHVFENNGMFPFRYLNGPEGKIRPVYLRLFPVHISPPAGVICIADIEEGIIIRSIRVSLCWLYMR